MKTTYNLNDQNDINKHREPEMSLLHKAVMLQEVLCCTTATQVWELHILAFEPVGFFPLNKNGFHRLSVAFKFIRKADGVTLCRHHTRVGQAQ